MPKFFVTYTREFRSEYECPTIQAADARAKTFAKNFPAGEVTIVSIYSEAEFYKPAEEEKKKLTKYEQMVDGMRAKINSMLPKEPA